MKSPFFRVLIVDDEYLIREGIAEGIEWQKLKCGPPLCAENGIEAVNIIKENDIDIVITDIKMPGMDGLELAKWIKESFDDISTLILTGYDDFKFAQSAIKYGVEDFILKPTKLEEIEAAVLKLTKKREVRETELELIQEAEEIIRKNRREEIAKIVYSLIFQGIEDEQELKYRLDKSEFNPQIIQLSLVEIGMKLDGVYKIDDKTRNYIEYLENELRHKLNNTKIEFISQMDRNCEIIFFYSLSKNIDKYNFKETVDNAINEVCSQLKDFSPFDINCGLSQIDKNMFSIKKMYYNALKNLDSKKVSKHNLLAAQGLKDINIEDIVDSSFKELIDKKDIQQMFEEIENIFKNIKENSATYYKSVAIQLIDYAANAINKSYVTKFIPKEKIYSNIIASNDIRDIEYIVKDTIRNLYTSIESFEKLEESSKLEDRIVDYIKGNYYKNLTLEKVAGEFYISPGHLNRIIKKSFGKTFLDLLTEIRVRNAEILLKNPKYKIYEVANAVGIKDPKYFSQVFKKFTGKTPSEYK